MSIICVGELLIDFISQDVGNKLENTDSFLKKAGGAPANVSCVLSRLGQDALFLGKVGDDSFGNFLEKQLKKHGVNTSLLKRDEKVSTTLAFVSIEEDGERDFSFVRGADANLEFSDLKMDELEKAKVIHFGSATSFLEGELKKTYKVLLEKALEKNKFISFDPNYRSAFWKGREEEFINEILYFIEKSDFLKLSEEEFKIICQTDNMKQGLAYLHKLGAKIIAITLGSRGTYISNGLESTILESISIKAIDTTGAGDAFVGAFIHHLLLNKLNINDFNLVKNCVIEANKIAALVCTKYGAMEALDVI